MRQDDIMIFMTRSIWLEMGISASDRKKKMKAVFGSTREILNREKAIACLKAVVDESTNTLLGMIISNPGLEILFQLLDIYSGILERYLTEKKSRTKMVKENIREEELLDAVTYNRNIERNIIDACNIWIENYVLHHDASRISVSRQTRKSSINKDLLLELYVYGCASQGLTLLMLSKDLAEGYFYGVSIDPEAEVPLNVLKKHPVIYFNPAV